MEKTGTALRGQGKKVYATDDASCCIVSYKDDATAFDGQKKGTIAGKGAVNNRMSNYLDAAFGKGRRAHPLRTGA